MGTRQIRLGGQVLFDTRWLLPLALFLYMAVLAGYAGIMYAAKWQSYCHGQTGFSIPAADLKNIDFHQFYTAAAVADQCTRDHNRNLYDAQAQFTVANSLIKPLAIEKAFILQYPPYFYAFLMPLAAFDVSRAWLAWTVFNVVLLALSAWVLTQGRRLSQRMLFMVALIASWPVMIGLFYGQTAVWFFAGLVAVFTLLRSSRFFAAGVATALGIIKLQYLPFVVVIGLILGKGKYAKGLAAAFAGLFIMSVLLFGTQSVMMYPHAIFAGEVTGFVPPMLMENVRGALACLYGIEGKAATVASLLAVAAGSLVLFLLWSKPSSGKLGDNDLSFNVRASLSILVILAASPHTFIHDYIVIFMSCFWLYDVISHNSRLSAVALCLLRVFILAFPALTVFFTSQREALPSVRFYFMYLITLSLFSLSCLSLQAAGRAKAMPWRLGELFLGAGIISQEQLNGCLRHSARTGMPLGECLLSQSVIDEAVLSSALKMQNRLRAGALSGEEAFGSLRLIGLRG